MKVAIVGSRSFQDYNLLKQTLAEYEITEIVSGGAKGALEGNAETLPVI